MASRKTWDVLSTDEDPEVDELLNDALDECLRFVFDFFFLSFFDLLAGFFDFLAFFLSSFLGSSLSDLFGVAGSDFLGSETEAAPSAAVTS